MKTMSRSQSMFAQAMQATYAKQDATKRKTRELSTVDFADRQRALEEEINRCMMEAGFKI
ncbi:hypothetical protein J9089_003242 [Salmonella enterica]|nr:hypothetical protein [Salmonella enterica]EHI7757774.1 hypothetical protein [Salmonella enterica]EHI8762917.1 hypothetical protein [Salmonella enterica]